MAYSRWSGEMPSDSFVLNAKLALQLADDDAPALANFQVDDGGNRLLLRHKSKSTPTLLRPASKAGWSRIPDLDEADNAKKSYSEPPSRPLRRQPSDAQGSAVRLFLRRSIHGCLKKPRDCVGCKSLITGDAVRLICGHFFEKPCLLSMVRACLSNEALFPPKCCEQAIPRTTFEPFMDAALAALYADKSVEYGTLERVYCARAACRRFLGPRTKGVHHIYTCPAPGCGTRTCSRCKMEVKKAVLHSCRPELPRKLSVPSQKPPLFIQGPAVHGPVKPEPKAKAKPPPPPLAPKPSQVKKTSSFQSITKMPILSVARKISQSLKAPSTVSLDKQIKAKGSLSPPVQLAPSAQSTESRTTTHSLQLVRKLSQSVRPVPAPPPPKPKSKPPPPPPPPKPPVQMTQLAPPTPAAKPKSRPPPPPPPPKPVRAQTASASVPVLPRHDRVRDPWAQSSTSASPPRAGAVAPPPRPSQQAPLPRASPPSPPRPAQPSRAATLAAAPPLVPGKPRRDRMGASAPAEQPGQMRPPVDGSGAVIARRVHTQEKRMRKHEMLPHEGALVPAHSVYYGAVPHGAAPYNPASRNPYPHNPTSYNPHSPAPYNPHNPFFHPPKYPHEPRSRVPTGRAYDEPRTPVGAHRLTMLDAQVDRLLRVVESYPCRHEWRVDLKREVCNACERRCVVIYGCTRCATKLCKTCQMQRM